jgi:hypothetical protein
MDTLLKPPEYKRNKLGQFDRPGKTLAKTAKVRRASNKLQTGQQHLEGQRVTQRQSRPADIQSARKGGPPTSMSSKSPLPGVDLADMATEMRVSVSENFKI